MLGRLRMSVDECIEKYLELSEAAFSLKRGKLNVIGRSKDLWKASGKYRSEVLANQFMGTTALVEGDQHALFYDPHGKCKVFVCAHSKANNTPVNIRSYTTDVSVDNMSLSECKIWEAARATSAASGFFDPIRIGWQDYVDGATGRNNPVDEVFSEAKGIWPDASSRIQCFVSIGTGIPEPKDFGENLAEIKKAIIAITTETEDTERRFYHHHESFGLGGRYFRFNVDKGLRDVSLDEFDKVGKIMIATESYLNGPRVQESIREFTQVVPVSSLYATVSEKEKNDYLNWLPYLDPRSTHNDARRYRTDSTTGNWFLESSFKEWKTEPKSFMWLHAKAGSGKTVLCSTIINHLEEQGDGTVAFFYFSHRMSGEQAVVWRLFQISLILQILKSLVRPEGRGFLVPNQFRELYQKYQPSREPSDEDLEDLFWYLLNLTAQSYIVVDALDECALHWGRAKVIEFLGHIPLRCRTKCHVLITSRREHDIEAVVRDLPLDKAIVPFDIGEVNADICHHLWKMVRSRPYAKWSPELQSEVVNYLVSRSEGVFRWADLQIRALTGQVRDRDVRRALPRLPQGLEATYERMLQQIEDNNKFEEAYAIFRWLAFSTTQLNLSALAELTAFEIEDPEQPPQSDHFSISFKPCDRFDEPSLIQTLLSDLVIFPHEDTSYRTFPSFSHSTVLEYLSSPRVSPAKFRLDPLDATWFIFKSSWAYINHYDTTPQGSRSQPYPLLEYASYEVWESALELVQRKASIKGQISRYLTPKSEERLLGNGITLHFSIWWFSHRIGLSLWGSPQAMGLLEFMNSTDLGYQKPFWYGSYQMPAIRDGRLLIEAAGAGRINMVRLLLDMRPIAEVVDHLGAAFRNASKKGSYLSISGHGGIDAADHTSVLRELLGVGANVNSVGWSGDTAIHHAAALGHLDIVTFLARWEGTYLEIPNGSGETPLSLASRFNHKSVVCLLLDLPGAVSHRGDVEGRTPLSLASEQGNIEVISLLLKHLNVDVNKTDCCGRTPLIWASVTGKRDVVEQLLTDPRVRPDERDHLGRTAVSWATLGGHESILRVLWARTDVTTYPRDHEGRELLAYACDRGHTSLVILLLERSNIDINTADYYQRTPLIWTRLRGRSNIEKLLLDDPRVLDVAPEKIPTVITASLQVPDEISKVEYIEHAASEEASERREDSATAGPESFSVSRIATINGVVSEIWALQFSHDGSRLAVCGAFEYVLIWDVHAGRPGVSLQGHDGGVPDTAWGPNDSMLLTVCRDGCLRLWDVEMWAALTLAQAATLLRCFRQITREPLSCCAWMPNDESFLASCYDQKHGFMKGTVDLEAVVYLETNYLVECFRLFPDGKRFVAADDHGNLFIYATETQSLKLRVKLPSPVCSLSVSKNSKDILVRLGDGDMLLVDSISSAVRPLSPGGTASDFVIDCCFGGQDESLILTGGEGK
ncbi:hypothetical protein FSARC_2364 [Fusarium sarcochroum]|uniref:phospholipase A2 n=1 Tax=Fusarium sarcochroum TaxID=1208366 RepID=A0A8H4U6Y6_9HYPO|nr:hypothetical protein FSARC_2364 [Fusarium sarcochroum]